MQTGILIVEDDHALASGLQRALTEENRRVETCGTLREAREKLHTDLPDLLILDVNLPDGSGYHFLEELRKHSAVPVILLTANDLETDIVAGLELGADDYITKPFSLAILRARVNAQLRKKTAPRRVFADNEFYFDFDRMEFFSNGEKVELSMTEQKLLYLLVENAGITLRREQLIDRVWTDGADYVDENALSVAVKRLRDKLHAKGVIQTVYGIGYVWNSRKGRC